MGKFAIRLLTPASYAAALVVVPAVTPAKAMTSGGKHTKHKKHWGPGFSDPRSADQVWPVTRPSRQAGAACQATPEASTVGRGLLQSMTT